MLNETFFCNFQTLWGPINSCCMFFKLHSIFQSWVDVTKSHLFHSPKSRPRPLMSVRVREKNVRFQVGLGELDWFSSWDPQFSSICSVLRFTQFFWVAMAMLKNPFWKVMKRALFDDHSEWFFLGKLFARKLVGTVFLSSSSHLSYMEKITLSDKSRENGLLTSSSSRWPKQLYYRIFRIKRNNEELDLLENTSTIEIQVLFKILIISKVLLKNRFESSYKCQKCSILWSNKY